MEKNQEEYEQEIKDFVKKYPLPIRADGIKFNFFLDLVVDNYMEDDDVDEITIKFLMEFDVIRRIYENILDKEIVKEYGRTLNQRGGFQSMMLSHYLLAGYIRLNNPNGELEHSPLRLHEQWWDGIGEWKHKNQTRVGRTLFIEIILKSSLEKIAKVRNKH